MTWYFQALFHEQADGYYIGAKDAWADLPYHLAILQGFAYGENFPPRDPLLYDARLAYPYLVDFIAALGVRSGLSLTAALLVQNVLLSALAHRSLTPLYSEGDPLAARCLPCAALSVLRRRPWLCALPAVTVARSPELSDDFTEHTNLLHWGNPLVYWF